MTTLAARLSSKRAMAGVATTGRKSDEECSACGRARFPGLPLGLGSDGSIRRHQQGRRRLFVRGRGQGGADDEERRQAAHLRDHHPHRRQRLFRPRLCGRASRRQRVRDQSDPLGSESAVDDIPREIQILNQIVNDPTINGVIMTTPQVGAYNDIVKKLEEKGVVVATTNSFDGTLLDRSNISHTGQDASAAAIGGEAIVKCLMKNNIKSGSILFPNTVPVGNIEVNNRVTAAFQATLKALKANNMLANFKVDAGPNNIGVDVGTDITAGPIVQLIESRKDVVGLFGPNGGVTPAIGDAISQLKLNGKVCAYGFDLGPKQLEQIKSGALMGSLGQQPFLQGFYPVMQLYLQLDRNIAAANLDTRAQLVTKENVDKVGKRFEN